jgi:hypothetical protein
MSQNSSSHSTHTTHTSSGLSTGDRMFCCTLKTVSDREDNCVNRTTGTGNRERDAAPSLRSTYYYCLLLLCFYIDYTFTCDS